MKSIASNIWRVPVYLPFTQPKLTSNGIESAERKIGFPLPKDLINLLKVQNGGYIRLCLTDLVHNRIAGIGPYFPSLGSFSLDECQDYVSFSLTGLIPFDGDGHWYLCLDYRRNPIEPSVTYIDFDYDEENCIATSFSNYLTLLRVNVEDEYVIDHVPDIEVFKAELATILKIQFDETNNWSSGYPVERAQLGTEDRPEWLWLSPNSVVRGFVRPDDARYSELKNLLPGKALRYPEIAEDAYLLSLHTTKKRTSTLLEAIKQCSLSVRPLREFISPQFL